MNLGIALKGMRKSACRRSPNSDSKKFKSDLKEVGFMKYYTAIVAIALLLVAAPFALAANGEGTIESYSPTAVTVGSTQDINFVLVNTGSTCIDEIIITPPSGWTNMSNVIVSYYSRGDKTVTNEADDGTFSGLVYDGQSVRIVPVNWLCPGERAEMTISGLKAPANPEDSVFSIFTSDQTHNEPSVNPVRQHILVEPIIRVTNAYGLKIEYLNIEASDFTGSNPTSFKGTAKGAWGRLSSLYLQGTVADPTVDIYIDSGQHAGYQPAEDIKIGTCSITTGIDTCTMNLYEPWNPAKNVAGQMEYGYVADGVQWSYYIVGYTSGTLTMKGHEDEARAPIPSNAVTGLDGAQGTIISVDAQGVARTVNVQLIDADRYDVNDDQIPIYFETDLGTFAPEVSPKTTDAKGNKFLALYPQCESGVANVHVWSPGLADSAVPNSVDEKVGINAGAPHSFDVTEGDGADVPAGESGLIEVTVYDQCGNVISNHPSKPTVNFDLTYTCGAAQLAQSPSEPPSSNFHEQEPTIMGVADVYLVTDCELCTHQIQISVNGLGQQTIYMTGVVGGPRKLVVKTYDTQMNPLEPGKEIDADDCFIATIEVTDLCGNRVEEIPSEVGDEMEQWESLTGLYLEDFQGMNFPDGKKITETSMRESDISPDGRSVQGKLNDGYATVKVCGCSELGVINVTAKSDTIIPGMDHVKVINSPAFCIKKEATSTGLKSCDESTELSIKVLDTCGNEMRDQECGAGAPAMYCVDLTLGGTCYESDAHLSTDTVCVNLKDPALNSPLTIYRDTERCCDLQVHAQKNGQCCLQPNIGALPQCSELSVKFYGKPYEMITEFFKTRKLCGPVCPIGAQCIQNTENGQHLECWEQLHEAFSMEGAVETVSEEVLDLFTVKDECGNIVPDYNGEVDVEIKGEDCASIYQVDHPLVLTGGWCQGHVDCSELTPFGEAKCEETPTTGGYCQWVQRGAHCEGELQCSAITNLGQTICQQVGCTWSGSACTGVSNCDREGIGPQKCAALQTAGCSWVTENTGYVCSGTAAQNSCRPYTKEQCQMVGAAQDPRTEGCEWINNCNREFENSILKKLVIHNCKPETEKQWLPLEKDDLIVDKLAFEMTFEEDPSLWLYVYLENEQTPGFQPGEDMLVGKAPAIFGGPTIIELKDSPTPYWDDQRQGGVLIRAGDSRDFYIALMNQDPQGPLTIPCGTYGLNFLYYQDYNSPDLTNFGSGYPDPDYDGIIEVNQLGGVVEDGCINSDNFNWIGPGLQAPHPVCPFNGPGLQLRKDSRNDDYGHTTPDYGFGDRYLYGLKFSAGQAWLKFRDLVAEDVEVHVLDIRESGETCPYTNNIEATPNPEEITFKEQPATQIKLINHDEPPKTAVCEGEWYAEENAYLFNIQVTDGFDNPVGKELEIELEYCLKMPFGDWMIENVMQFYCISHGDEDVCDELWYNKDRCYTREDLKKLIEASEYAHGFDNLLFGDFFGKEFADWIDQYFMEAKVEFWDSDEHALPFDSHGHQVVMTDSNGQAQVYVTAQKTGVYKVIARPLALDGDWAMVSFEGGIPEKLDLMALPSFGVPADGEQEAMLFLRTLDACGNLVHQPIRDVTVEVTQGTQVYISQDFECKNNYDGDVTGILYGKGFLGETCLAVLSDLPQTATLMAKAPGMYSDTTQISFQGAPVKLAITKIEPSDRLPADGQTGAWVTIQVQDKNGNRITGYLGNGFSGDPGDPWGFTDYRFENICIDLDDLEASIAPWFLDVDKTTYGWVNFHSAGPSRYCGDLMFGEGKIYVTYGNPDCNHGGTVNVKVWDEMPWQGQEFDENGIPVSVHATQLTPASGHVDFVDPASQWNLMADKAIALADGKSTVRIEVQVENPFMDVRQAIDGVVYIGGQAEDGAVLSWNGMIDSLNPTSARFVTDPTTGKTYLELTSTTPGKAEITVTGGDAYVCMGLDDITLKGCLAWCGERLPFRADCMSLCLSGDIGTYNCPTCEEYIPKFWCGYSSKQDLTPKTIEVEFLEVASKQIFLDKGWNFISVPYALLNTSDQMSELFNMSNVVQAWKYNGGWTALSGSSALAPLNGYWIKVLQPEVVTLKYATMDMPSIPTRTINAGWNAVGLAWDSPITMRNALMSINNVYSNVIGWIAGLQKYGIPVANTGGSGPFETGGVNMEPKQGYWVWATASGTLAGLAA